ncbi:polyprenyl synthetase family protein [Verrucomicrobiota bacterium]
MILEEIYKNIESDLKLVEKRLPEMSQSKNSVISQAVMQIFNGGGKRLRPALLLMAARACGYTGEGGVDLAVAVELMHTASLVHDDVIDNADKRRSTSTINFRWGNKTAILVGDHLYSKVICILAENGNIDMMQCVASAACSMTESEMTQSLWRNDINVTEDKYLSIVKGKTSALMSCSCRVGAMLAENCNGEMDILGDYGLNLGMAFQITDDLLDIIGEERKVGKPLLKDIREGNLTLPFIYAAGKAVEKDREWMMEKFRTGQIDENSLARINDIVRDYGGIKYSLGKALEYGRICKEKLEKLPESDSRTSLYKLVDYVIERVS